MGDSPPSTGPPSFGDSAGSVYSALVDEQLARQNERKASLEARGMAVIASSGTLVSLLFALAAVVTASDTFSLSEPARILLISALIVFLIASGLGIAVNWIREYENILTSELTRLTDPTLWEGRAGIASRRVAEAKISILAKTRRHNDRKATFLRTAMAGEVLAIAIVAAAVILILTQA